MRFKIDWPSLIDGSKFTIFAMVLGAIFQVQAPGGTYICRGDLTEVFLRYRFGGLIYIWRGLYMAGLIFGILGYPDSELKRPKF